MTRTRSILLLGALLWTAVASAQYKSIGPDGRVTYSDIAPPPPARVVEQRKATDTGTAPAALPYELQQATSRYPVTIYTGDNCAPCEAGKAFLRSRGVPFTEKTVTSDDDVALFRQQSPNGTAPVIAVGSRKFVGFAQSTWTGLLDSAGYPNASLLPRDFQNAPATPLSPSTISTAQAQSAPGAPPRAGSTAGSNPPPPANNPSGFRF